MASSSYLTKLLRGKLNLVILSATIAPLAIHKLEREEGDLRWEINHLEGSNLTWRRRKTPSEGKP
jgi:hypothetical protein